MSRLAKKSLSAKQAERATVHAPSLFWVALGALLLLGLVLRVAGSMGELWLDELWSLMLATRLKSSSQIFTGLHLDNNHYLISLWMRICGADRAWWVYRVPSILAGMGAALAAIRIGLGRPQHNALVAGVLLALAYLAGFYSS